MVEPNTTGIVFGAQPVCLLPICHSAKEGPLLLLCFHCYIALLIMCNTFLERYIISVNIARL